MSTAADQGASTPLVRRARTSDVSAIKRLVEPAEVAAAVRYLCSDDAAFVNGTSLSLDGGWTAR